MDKAYEPHQHEDDIYQKWEASGAFQPSNDPSKKPFTIPIPPPNVTGTLHAGHSMFITLQDILIRWHRMLGDAALWIPGTDHAAIATESVVLKQLEIKDRNKDISREKFLEEARKWTAKTHARITEQVRKMGASCDWTREAYTFDEPRNHAVNVIFKKLYDKGLIYRGDRMVNWSVGAQSVLADDEVEWEDRSDTFYSIRCGEFIMGTVRAETKCSDSPLFVNSAGEYARVRYTQNDGVSETIIIAKNLFDDAPRRKKLLNLLEKEDSTVELVEVMKGADLVGQEFEYETYAAKRNFVVMADDEIIDMDKGTGTMTISVLHSQDDYDLAQKHGLDQYRFEKIGFDGRMKAIAGTEVEGLAIEVARKKAAEIMKAKGLLVGEDKNYLHRVPVCYRSGTVVEPMVSRQWFVDVEKEFVPDFPPAEGRGLRGGFGAESTPQPPLTGGQNSATASPLVKGDLGDSQKTTLKKMTADAVRGNEVTIIPKQFEKTYFHWIDNLRDWCISRQIWWGHRIPVWYRGEEIFVGTEAPTGEGWIQDEDTLDTWFSSALWPFSTLGWPDEQNTDFQRFYPTSILETGHDILFFWVARMIMFGKFATGKYPFDTVYLHGLVCDAKGQKMSKSKGNGVDPLEIIEKFGTDALRLSLIIGTTPGNNANLGEEKIAGCRNLCNKLWNISRFILSQSPPSDKGELEGGCDEKNNTPQSLLVREEEKTDLQNWIIAKTDDLITEITSDLEKYRFGDAAQKLWNFTWNEFADWAVEAAKAESNPNTLACLRESLKTQLKLWHPFIPFVTEAIWQEGKLGGNLLISAEWPAVSGKNSSAKAFEQVCEIAGKIRSMRKLAGVDPTRKISAYIFGKNLEILEENATIIKSLARIASLTFETEPTKRTTEDGATDMAAGTTIFLPSSGMIDPAVEQARVQKELEAAKAQLVGLLAKLNNDGFLKSAPSNVVEQARAKAQELEEKVKTLEAKGL